MIAEVNTMTINQITQNNLKSTIFPLPPLAEQKRIVAKIGQLMALCDKLEVERNERNQKRLTIHTAGMNRLLSSPHKIDFSTSWEFITKNFSELYSVPKNVEELKKAILQLAVMGKLVPQDPNDQPASELLKEIEAEKKRLIKEGKIKKQEPLPSIKPEEIPYEVPKGWEWRFLADICFKITDGFHNTPKKLDTGKIYISATHIREQGIRWNECLFVSEKDHDELFKKAYPQRGEILITNRGAGCGTPAIIDINGEFSFQNAAIIGFNQEKIYNKFVFYYLILNRDHIVQHFVSGGMQPMLSNVTLSTIPFPIPPITEQKRIVAKIDQLMELCNSLGQQIKDSTEKQTAILNAVFARV
jgi:type I restriction enzyme S subunit